MNHQPRLTGLVGGSGTRADTLEDMAEGGWAHLRADLGAEIGRFMAVGGIATAAAFVVFNFLAHGLYLTDDPWLHGQPITAFIIGNLVGMSINYRLSRHWTFKHRPPKHADGGRTAFLVINVVTMLVPIGCLWFSRHVLGLTDPISDNLFGGVIGLLLGQAARFHLFRTYVFQKPAHPPLHMLLSAEDDDPADATRPSTGARAQPGDPATAAS